LHEPFGLELTQEWFENLRNVYSLMQGMAFRNETLLPILFKQFIEKHQLLFEV
jgi:hypothetical protein